MSIFTQTNLCTCVKHLCVMISALSRCQLLQIMSWGEHWALRWQTHTRTHILKHTHIPSPITNDEHTPDMIITLSSSLSTSVRMFSLRDSSMDRDRAFLFLGLFKTILLEEDKTLLSVYNSFTLKHWVLFCFAKTGHSFYSCWNEKSHNIRDGKMTSVKNVEHNFVVGNILNVI